MASLTPTLHKGKAGGLCHECLAYQDAKNAFRLNPLCVMMLRSVPSSIVMACVGTVTNRAFVVR